YDDMKTRVMGDLKKVFRPELLNRIDEIIVFPKLAKDEILQIVDLLMNRLRVQMAEFEVTIELTDEAMDLLVEKGWDPTMGARPLRRAIQRHIEDPLSEKILFGEVRPGQLITVDENTETGAIESEQRFTFKSGPKENVPEDASVLESGTLPPAAPEATPPISA
ncbi:MAG: NDP-hexose 4-ketoreductase, partial [Catenulispora sp.]